MEQGTIFSFHSSCGGQDHVFVTISIYMALGLTLSTGGTFNAQSTQVTAYKVPSENQGILRGKKGSISRQTSHLQDRLRFSYKKWCEPWPGTEVRANEPLKAADSGFVQLLVGTIQLVAVLVNCG